MEESETTTMTNPNNSTGLLLWAAHGAGGAGTGIGSSGSFKREASHHQGLLVPEFCEAVHMIQDISGDHLKIF